MGKTQNFKLRSFSFGSSFLTFCFVCKFIDNACRSINWKFCQNLLIALPQKLKSAFQTTGLLLIHVLLFVFCIYMSLSGVHVLMLHNCMSKLVYNFRKWLTQQYLLKPVSLFNQLNSFLSCFLTFFFGSGLVLILY